MPPSVSLGFPRKRPSSPLPPNAPRRSLALPMTLSSIRFFVPSLPFSMRASPMSETLAPSPFPRPCLPQSVSPFLSRLQPPTPRPRPTAPPLLVGGALPSVAQLGAGPALSPTPHGRKAALSGWGWIGRRGRWLECGEAGGIRQEAAAAALSSAAPREGSARREPAAGLGSASSAARRPGPGPMPSAPPDRP